MITVSVVIAFKLFQQLCFALAFSSNGYPFALLALQKTIAILDAMFNSVFSINRCFVEYLFKAFVLNTQASEKRLGASGRWKRLGSNALETVFHSWTSHV